ncbi:hypothetical protein [Methanococcoides sp. AM1]|uniref:hypothetical protein n=1 Tax=Methanococcoides sp. AM1 TaxID=1201011 RepID=UPI001438460A|nr:hypothetical protein [Methanococcoides sp. AM1]
MGHIELEGDDEIISVVPAPPKSYRVTGLTKDRKWAELGYEFDGADHPDWLKVLKDEFW